MCSCRRSKSVITQRRVLGSFLPPELALVEEEEGEGEEGFNHRGFMSALVLLQAQRPHGAARACLWQCDGKAGRAARSSPAPTSGALLLTHRRGTGTLT
jgi:hypothetical protein